jgi:hypothetical protein
VQLLMISMQLGCSEMMREDVCTLYLKFQSLYERHWHQIFSPVTSDWGQCHYPSRIKSKSAALHNESVDRRGKVHAYCRICINVEAMILSQGKTNFQPYIARHFY